MSVGANANVGTVWSTGGVFLRSHAAVTGDVNLGGTLTRQDGTTITGRVNQTSALAPADVLSWSFTWPTTSGGNIDAQPNQVVTKAPGRFGAVSVKGTATLALSSGIYFVDALAFESGSKLLLDETSGPVTIYTRGGFTFRGVEQTVSGAAPDVLVLATGTSPIVVETSFTGSIVAPSASLTLGSNGGAFAGAFHGKDVVVRSDVTITPRRSAAWAEVPACRALTPAEKTTATAQGLSPVLYPVLGREVKQGLPIPVGQTWKIGLRYDSGIQRQGTAGRFRVISLDAQGKVEGGSTFLLRQ